MDEESKDIILKGEGYVMAVVKLVGVELVGADSYRIRCGTDFSETAGLGEGIEWKAPNGKLYLSYIDLPLDGGDEASEVESEFDHLVYEARPIADAEIEEGEDDGTGDADDAGDDGDTDDDDDDDDGGDDDGGEEVQVAA